MLEDWLVESGDPAENNLRWERHPGNPVLRPSAANGWSEEWIANGTVLRIKDRYLMFMEGKSGPVYRIGLKIAEAATFDGVTWQDNPENPILDIAPKGYDAMGVLDPSVIRFRGRYYLYHTALCGPPDHVALAISDDGYHFTKYDKNPLFAGRCPFAIVLRNMVYVFHLRFNEDGGYDLHLAISSNGLEFTRHEMRPILPRGIEGEWDSFSIVTPRIFLEGDVYKMIYAADSQHVDEPRGFGLAFSSDLVSWLKFEGNPIFTPGLPGEWDSQAVWCPWVERQADQYWMWYCGSATTYDEGLTPMVGMAKLGGGLR
jgi:predicted GH43/DUF377 family glycosyl hydrolase